MRKRIVDGILEFTLIGLCRRYITKLSLTSRKLKSTSQQHLHEGNAKPTLIVLAYISALQLYKPNQSP